MPKATIHYEVVPEAPRSWDNPLNWPNLGFWVASDTDAVYLVGKTVVLYIGRSWEVLE